MNWPDLLSWCQAVLDDTANYIRFLVQEDFALHTLLGTVNPSGDKMTAFDAAVNARLKQQIRERERELPAILISEETGVEFLSRRPEFFFLLDPVDGSNNVRPHVTPAPHLCMSLGVGKLKDLEEQKGPDAISVSVHREIFGEQAYCAVTGQGARVRIAGRHDNRIAPSRVQSLAAGSVIGLDLDECRRLPPGIIRLLERGIMQRRLGSSILDFCQVASGQYDAYVSYMGRLKITDVCQSCHLVRQAGGQFSYELLRNGEPDPDLQRDFLHRVLAEPYLLKQVRFRLLAAGTAGLLAELKGLLAAG